MLRTIAHLFAPRRRDLLIIELTLTPAIWRTIIQTYGIALSLGNRTRTDISSPNALLFPAASRRGKTRDEAVANIKEAITGYLASLQKHGEAIPPPITEEIVEV
jgi:hypothetical protein